MIGTDDAWSRTPFKKRKSSGRIFSSRKQGLVVDDAWTLPEKGRGQRNRKTVEEESETRGDTVRDYAWGPDRGVSYETRVTTRGTMPSMTYAQRTPWPTYSQWGSPHWVDVNTGIQYKKADGSDWAHLVHEGVISKPAWDVSDPNGGTQLLYLRLPRGSRTLEGAGFPSEFDTLELLHLDTGSVWKARVVATEGAENKNAATGNVRVANLERKTSKASSNVVEKAYVRLPKRYQKLKLLR